MPGPGEIPKIMLPCEPNALQEYLRRLRAHATLLDADLKTTRGMINMLEKQCAHKNAEVWNTGDGDGSQGFRCLDCGTVGER